MKPLLQWNLAELLQVAKAAGWLPSVLEYGKHEWNAKIAEIGTMQNWCGNCAISLIRRGI